MIATNPEGLTSHFWDKLAHGIYFLKADSPRRAWPVINEACETAATEITHDPGSFILGLLTTLSPPNMMPCPALRVSLLKFLTGLASVCLGAIHPLAVLARELRWRSAVQDWVPASALSCAVDSFETALGPKHDLTLTAQLRRIAFLRRTREYDQALRLGQATMAATTALHGPFSLEARRVARKLKHVYMGHPHYGRYGQDL
jgi:hypothetical protein